MKSPEMNRIIICVGGLIAMFEAINSYHFSFMEVPALLAFIVLFILLAYFDNTLVFYIWGLFTGIVVLVPFVIALFHFTNNYIAYLFDGLLSVFLLGFFGFKTYKKINTKKENSM
ncbi:MAG: hypothetical protein ACLUVC_13330 [Longibaculum sp.]